MCDNRHESDIQMVLSTLGLANPISERLLNKYLLDGPIGRAGSRIGKWNDLLINMWSSFIDSSKELSLEENEAILCSPLLLIHPQVHSLQHHSSQHAAL